MNQQKVVIAEDLGQSLKEAMEACERDKVFVLLDETTERCCLPVVEAAIGLQDAKRIIIGATDTHKNLESLAHVWEELGSVWIWRADSPISRKSGN